MRDRFVEDIYLAKRVKAAGLPDPHGDGHGDQLDADVHLPPADRRGAGAESSTMRWAAAPGLLVGKILEPLVFSQTFLSRSWLGLMSWDFHGSGDNRLAAGAVAGASGLADQGALSHVPLVVAATAIDAVWYPLAGLVSDWILVAAIWMCVTGKVTWRGTSYEADQGSVRQ